MTGEAIAERPDGTRIPFAAYPKPLRDASGRLVGAVNTLVDITHIKAHEERRLLSDPPDGAAARRRAP